MLGLLLRLIPFPAPRGRTRRPALRHRPALEALEDRTVPSTIVWTNRGSSLADTDHFNAVFGARANAARAVVDAVIAAWENVIANFNYSDGSHTFKLTLSEAPGWDNMNGSTSFAQRVDANGKPFDSTTVIGAGADGHGAGWYIDPTPSDYSEYRGDIFNAFVARATPGSAAANIADLYTLVSHELLTGLGLTANPAAAFLKDTHHYLAPTGQTDSFFGVGKLYTFSSPDVQVLFTSNNFGFGGSDFGAPLHVAMPGMSYTNAAGVTYSGTLDVDNPLYYYNRRYLPSQLDALILKDVYGYTLNAPQTFGTFYTNLDSSTGQLLVRSLDAGTDTITLAHQGSSVAVTVTVAYPAPGPGLTGPMTSLFAPASIKSIVVQTGGGSHTVNVESTDAGVPVTINDGGGSDTINVVPSSQTLANLHSLLTINGGSGSDTLVVNDQARTDATGTYVIQAGSVARGSAVVTYSHIANLFLNTGRGGDIVSVQGTSAATTVNVAGGSTGINTVQIGNAANRLDDVQAPVAVNAQGGWNLLYVEDYGSTVGQKFTLAGNTLTRSGAAPITFGGFLVLFVNAGSGNDTFTVTALPAGTTAVLNGGLGNNTLAGPNTTNTWRISSTNGGSLDGGLTFSNMANLVGGTGADTFSFNDGQGVTGSIDGGGGTDTLDYSAYTGAVTVNLRTGVATGVKGGVRNIGKVIGGKGSNNIS